MAGDCGLNALSLLPEKVLPQWQQKIALRAENPSGHTAYNDMVEANFLRSNFLQVLDLLIFLQKQPGHWGRLSAFSPSFIESISTFIPRFCFRFVGMIAAKIRIKRGV